MRIADLHLPRCYFSGVFYDGALIMRTTGTWRPGRLLRRGLALLAILGWVDGAAHFAGNAQAGSAPAAAPGAPPAKEDKPAVIVVVGAPGEEEYGKNFAEWAAHWEKASREAGARLVTIGLKKAPTGTDRERLQRALLDEPKSQAAELWLVLIGHGTFDGKEAKFNLQGPDLSAAELAEWLKPFQRPLAVINTSSSSGPFLNTLSAPGRVVITATRSGHELNYARFGQYLSEALLDLKADLDKDGQVSLLEAYLSASHRVAEFYESEGRLATEHALLDDNGDGRGTPADWFRGVRAIKKADQGASVDGHRAHQFHLIRSEQERRMPAAIRAQRDELEMAVIKLREAKAGLKEDDYYHRLEDLLLKLARLYQQEEKAKP